VNKFTGLGEQYDGGRDVYVQQEGSHVQLSVEAQSGANSGVTLLTPAQARAVSDSLLKFAAEADQYGGIEE
jgi:hypothetical protein